MRIHHIIIAIIVFSLFAVMMFSETQKLYSGDGTEGNAGLGLNKADYIDNETAFFSELDVITQTEDKAVDMADQSPGGSNIVISGDDDTTEGSLQKSGLGVVTSVGKFLFEVPKTLITSVVNYLQIDPVFGTVSITILLIIVSIILVSSVLRNRL